MNNEIKQQNVRFYNEEACVYDQIRYGNAKGRRVDDFQKRILDRFLLNEISHDDTVLEVGCGTGRFLLHLAKNHFYLEGIDVSHEMLAMAQSKVEDRRLSNVSLSLQDASKMKFNNGTFKAVYSILVLNLVPDYLSVFREVYRVLQPDGIFVMSVPYMDSIYYPIGKLVNFNGRTTTANASGYRYSHWFSQREVTESLGKAGFEILDQCGQPPYVRYLNNTKPLSNSVLGRMLSKSIYIKAKKMDI